MTDLLHLLMVLGISMLPFVELRGAIPYGFGFGLDWLPVMLVSVIGNMIPVPFIVLFIRKILKWMEKWGKFGKLVAKIEAKADKGAAKVRERKALWVGLMLFVAIPLPGTGAWTGALIAAALNMRLKTAVPPIALGVVIAAFIVSGLTYGFLGAIF